MREKMTKVVKILLMYTSREGQTKKIMEKISLDIEAQAEVVLHQIMTKDDSIELGSFDIVVIGSSIRYGYYPKFLNEWIEKNKIILNQKISAFIGVNLVARKENKNTPETNIYTKKFLEQSSWNPTMSAVFAGALYYPRYNWLDRNIIRFIMWLGKGSTDTQKEQIEYTNWLDVESFATKLCKFINKLK